MRQFSAWRNGIISNYELFKCASDHFFLDSRNSRNAVFKSKTIQMAFYTQMRSMAHISAIKITALGSFIAAVEGMHLMEGKNKNSKMEIIIILLLMFLYENIYITCTTIFLPLECIVWLLSHSTNNNHFK